MFKLLISLFIIKYLSDVNNHALDVKVHLQIIFYFSLFLSELIK
jgi:hypothetical protein